MANEYKINKFIELRPSNDKTVIVVNKEDFGAFDYFLGDENINDFKKYVEHIIPINNAPKIWDNLSQSPKKYEDIPISIKFRDNYQKIKVWADNGYNPRLFPPVLSFFLLDTLTKKGDDKAKVVFKNVVRKMFKNGNFKTLYFLTHGYFLDIFEKEELLSLKLDINSLFLKEIGQLLDEEKSSREVAFPLLNTLVKKGIDSVKQIFNNEIIKWLKRGDLSQIQFLLNEKFLNHLETQELENILFNKGSNFLINLKNAFQRDRSTKRVALPMLLKLNKLNIPSANKIMKKELIKRIKSGNPLMILYLSGTGYDYINYLSLEDLKSIFEKSPSTFTRNLSLLKYLLKFGNPQAEELFKTEICNQLNEGDYYSFLYIMEHYFDFLSKEEQDEFLLNPSDLFVDRVNEEHSKMMFERQKSVEWDILPNGDLKDKYPEEPKYDWEKLLIRIEKI